MSEATAPKAESKARKPRGIRLAEAPKVTEIPETTGARRACLHFSFIHADAAIQQRETLDAAVIAEYASGIGDWIEMAPLTVFHDESTYWLADGFHRHAACKVEKLESVPVIIHKGTRLDALRFALGANAKHGKRRTGADLAKAYRRAVEEGFCQPDDSESVSLVLNCSVRWARELTFEYRNRQELERDATAKRLAEEGLTQRQIAAELGVSLGKVNALVQKRNPSETEQDQPPADQPQAEPSTVPELVMDSPALQAAKVAYQGLSASDAFAFQVWFASIRTAERRGESS